MTNLSACIQLSKISLYLNRKLILWLAVIFGLLFLCSANTGPQFSALYHCVLFIGGALISSAAFRDIHDSGLNIHMLTLPISATMRYLSAWLLTGPAYFIFISLLYGIGMLAHDVNGTLWSGFGSALGMVWIALNYLIVNVVFLLGGLYFKKHALLKTIGSLLLLGFCSALIKHVAFNGGWILLFSDQISQWIWVGLGLLASILIYMQLKRSELK